MMKCILNAIFAAVVIYFWGVSIWTAAGTLFILSLITDWFTARGQDRSRFFYLTAKWELESNFFGLTITSLGATIVGYLILQLIITI